MTVLIVLFRAISRVKRTGAALTTLPVNMAADTQGASETIIAKSFLSAALEALTPA
jgi:hypothetical protein